MTKEEKYRKALLEARAVLEPCLKYSNGKVREALDSIDNELKSFESEDERIREWLVYYFKAIGKSWLHHRDISIEQILAYLEKQKEPKHATDSKSERVIKAARSVLNNWLDGTDCPDVSGDFAELEYAIREYDGEEKQKEPHKRLRDKTPWIVTAKEELAHDEERLQANLEELHRIRAEKEKQKEQKPAECEDCAMYLSGNCILPNGKCENVKSKQEWSVDDELMMKAIIGILDENDHPKLCSWLKSLRPQPKQEWTEEEKQKLNRIYSIIGWAMDEHAFSSCKKLIGDKEGVELQDFLRSIAKPEQQPSWKPSEEQMEALNALNCHGDLSYIGQQNQLISLYNDLKKLM